jgi:hypothetical protein
MVHRYVQYNGHGLIIHVNFMVKCVYMGYGSNDFVTKARPFPTDGHYRTDIINDVGHSRLDSIVPLVLFTVAMQYPGHWYCTTDPLGQRQPY